MGRGIEKFNQDQHIKMGRIAYLVQAGVNLLRPFIECCLDINRLFVYRPVLFVVLCSSRPRIIQCFRDIRFGVVGQRFTQFGKRVFANDALDMDIGRVARRELFGRNVVFHIGLLAVVADLDAVL